MSTVADDLLLGPRGRGLCLAAVAHVDEAVSVALFWLAHQLDVNPGTLLRIGASESVDVEDPSFTEAEIAELIRAADIAQITHETLRIAFGATVDRARYWQEPDGHDVVAALPAVRAALAPVAVLVADLMPALAAPRTSEQWAVDWRAAADGAPVERHPDAVLAAWSCEQRDEELRAVVERPSGPHAPWSGQWWSVPLGLLATRARAMDALELVEDQLGWEVATLIPVRGAGRTLEITSADEWAALCHDYPLEVTASRRHDWFRVTGRDGRWVIPDWEQVALQWDAVHLTTLGYLSAATKLIEIDRERASVIAGWGPDSTIWLTDVAREWDEPRQQWHRAGGHGEWRPSAGGATAR